MLLRLIPPSQKRQSTTAVCPRTNKFSFGVSFNWRWKEAPSSRNSTFPMRSYSRQWMKNYVPSLSSGEPLTRPLLVTVGAPVCVLVEAIGGCALGVPTWFPILPNSTWHCIGKRCIFNRRPNYERQEASEMRSRPKLRPGTCEISSISCGSISKRKQIGNMCRSTVPFPRKEISQSMQNPPPPNHPRYNEQRLAGLRTYATQQRQATLSRLHAAITMLKEKGEPITVHTIREASGLDYKSIARNPEALALFHQHSTFLAAKRKETKKKRKPGREEEIPRQKDPLLNYKRPQLVARVRQEMQRR